MENDTYADYLTEWQAERGDAEYGEFVYYMHGQEWSMRLQKMSHERFCDSLVLLHELNAEYGSLLPAEPGQPTSPENEQRIYMLLLAMLPLELALFC